MPDLADVRTPGNLLAHIGCRMDRSAEERTVGIRVARGVKPEAPYELVKTMRASVVVFGPLVARWGKARVSLPGGCAVGALPIDQHLRGLAGRTRPEIRLEHGYVQAPRRLQRAAFTLDGWRVTGTENVMLAATLAEERTVLSNCAREPEVVDLANALVGMGAD